LSVEGLMESIWIHVAPAVFLIGSYLAGWTACAIAAAAGAGYYCYLAVTRFPDSGVLSGLISFVVVLFFTVMHRGTMARAAAVRTRQLAAARREEGDIATKLAAIKDELSLHSKDLEATLQYYSLIKGLADTAEWRRMGTIIEQALRRFLGAGDYALYLLDSEQVLKLVVRRGSWAATLAIPDTLREPAIVPASQLGTTRRDERLLCLPFLHKQQLFGVILVAADAARAQDGDLVRQLWSLLTLGIVRARIYWAMEQESLNDGLTKLLRRNHCEERLRDLIKRSAFFTTTFGIMLIDLDHFKQINDTYGHQAGDQVLRRVSQILQAGIYETDMVGRWGGEEFICLFPRTDPAGLRIKADKLRQAVEQEAFYVGLEQIRLTISVGIAFFPRDGAVLAGLLEAADRALYQAKASGRNRVVDLSK